MKRVAQQRTTTFATAIVACCAWATALADAGSHIPPAYLDVARAAGIPAAVLYAIAVTESGVRLQSGQIRPWPWTLNVAGASRRYASRRDAYVALRQVLASGRRNVDIGVAQVNWRWNGHRFVDAWAALDPLTNLKASARLLGELRARSGDWPQAAARYYGASDAKRRHAYRQRFVRHWHGARS